MFYARGVRARFEHLWNEYHLNDIESVNIRRLNEEVPARSHKRLHFRKECPWIRNMLDYMV